MRYFFVILIIFIGCSEKTKSENTIHPIIQKQNIKKDINDTNSSISITKPKSTNIEIEDLIFKQTDNNISYSFENKKILVFLDDNKFSNFQVDELEKLKKRFYIINNNKLANYFKIKKYPTIIITKDNNHTKKYEGFIPAEILKYEIKE